MGADSASWSSLVSRATQLAQSSDRSLLAITGPPGSGKSTLAARLVAELSRLGLAESVGQAPMDGFHLSNAELVRLGRRNRKGAIDTFDALGYLALLRRLIARDEDVVYAPSFDRAIEEPVAGSLPIPQTVRLVICEGNYLLADSEPWHRLAALFTLSCYCDVPDDIRRARLVARHRQFGKGVEEALAWAHGSDQVNSDLVERTRDRADVIYRSEQA
jgi:pantothenate kinase